MIIALNNKCNLTKDEFLTYQQDLEKISTTHKLILCPSLVHLSNFNLNNCSLGSQNVSKNASGAHTGEISANQLKSCSVEYCIVGHSERREECKETSEETNLKIKNLFKEQIIPILCVGESLKEREAGIEKEVLREELTLAIKDLSEEEKEKLIIAYEPIWSIGTGIIPTIEQIKDVFIFIKEILPTSKILYGGSANETNIMELKKCELIDGYLLGGLSLKPQKLEEFLEKLEN